MPSSSYKKLLNRLMVRMNPNRGNPLFGEEVARRIKEKGSIYIPPSFEGEAAPATALAKKLMASRVPFIRSLGRKIKAKHPEIHELSGMDSTPTGERALKRLIDEDKFVISGRHLTPEDADIFFPGVKRKNLNITSQRTQNALEGMGNNKALEANAFKGVGRTEVLAELLKRKKKGETLKQLLDREFGESGWVAKRTDGSNSIGSRGTKVPKIFFSHDDNAEKIRNISKRQMEDWIVQPNKQLESVSPIKKKINKALVPVTGNMSNMNEYRVHVINGKVVPYATVHRGDATKSLIQPFLPFRPKELLDAERYAQKQINNLKNKQLRKGNYGFDVAFDVHGKPQLVETNPSTDEGLSGFLKSPIVGDAISAAAAGRLPLYVKARRAAWGGAGLAAGAYGLNKIKHMSDNPAPEEQAAEGQEMAKVATSFGATKKLLRYLESQGIKTTRDPKLLYRLERGKGAASMLPKDISKARAEVDAAKFVPYPAAKGGNGTIYVGRDLANHPHLQEDIKRYRNYSPNPREALFHEAGHAIHHLEDPHAALNAMRSPTEAMADELAKERIANNNAINFMRENNVSSGLLERYKNNLAIPFKAYSNYAKGIANENPGYKGKELHRKEHFSV